MKEDSKATLKDWLEFIGFTLIVFLFGLTWGFWIGRNHPSTEVKTEWLADLRNEVNQLESSYKSIVQDRDETIAWKDSLISSMRRHIANGESADTPIVVYVNLDEDVE